MKASRQETRLRYIHVSKPFNGTIYCEKNTWGSIHNHNMNMVLQPGLIIQVSKRKCAILWMNLQQQHSKKIIENSGIEVIQEHIFLCKSICCNRIIIVSCYRSAYYADLKKIKAIAEHVWNWVHKKGYA